MKQEREEWEGYCSQPGVEGRSKWLGSGIQCHWEVPP